MSSIDDPIQAVKSQHREQPDSVLELITNVASALHPFAGMVNAIRTHFSRRGAEERTRALLEALEDAVRQDQTSIEQFRSQFESPEFIHALTEGVSEAIRTSSQIQIARFGAVLGRSVAESADLSEAAAYVRDLAQLTELDISALRILYLVQRDLVTQATVTTDPNPYTERITSVLEAVDQAGLPREEFYARCSRLTGFGLALEVHRNDARMALRDHCFRLTKRAAKLVELIAGY